MSIDWHYILAGASTVVLLASVIPYVYTIRRGTTRPNPLTVVGWFLLAALPAVAQIVKGADLSVVVPIMATLNSLLVLVVAVGAEKYFPIQKTDVLAFSLGLLATVAWALTDEPLAAIYLSLVADVIFSTPTILKVAKYPDTEPVWPWLIYALGSFLGLAAVTSYVAHNVAFPLYSLCFGLLMATFALRKYLR